MSGSSQRLNSFRKLNIKILLILLTVLLMGIFLGSAITDQEQLFKLVLSDDSILMGVFTVAVGGFIGAYSAFWLKSSEEIKKKEDEYKSALNAALFVLYKQINAVKCIRIDLDNYKTPFERFLMPVMVYSDCSNLKQRIDSLDILMRKECGQALMDLTIEQERFESVLLSIEIRNAFHLNSIQPNLSKASGHYVINDLEKCEKILGSYSFNIAKNQIESVYFHVFETEKSLIKYYADLFSISKILFPDGEFLNVQNA